MSKKSSQAAASAELQQAAEQVESELAQKHRHPVVNTVINVILVLAMILAAICTYVSYVSSSGSGVPSFFGLRVLSVQTESMYPTINAGDLIIDKGVSDPSTLEVGDIITYWTVIDGERVLNTHRITAIYDGGGYLIFATKGDNNTSEDSLTVHESEVVGRYWVRIGGLGKAMDYLQTSTGFLICILIPVFIFFLYHLIQFFRTLFEYQNVKNRLKYELERGELEDVAAQADQERERKRKEIEDQMREQIKAELLASMKADAQAPPAGQGQNAPESAPAQEEQSVPAGQDEGDRA
ncbi:MAG: signal peptidase I [Oscillospiraceae bacterium]|nr:signal peptidase I [Oscillospiraceae bacterium]